MILMVLAFLAAGCSSEGDDKADDKADGSSAGGSSGSDSSADGSTPSPSKGSSKQTDGDGTDPMKNDNGAPGSPDKKGRQNVLFSRLPGNSTGACEKVGNGRDVKSGGFVGGAFDDARKSYGKVRPGVGRRQVRLYWIPQHSKPMAGVIVTATSGGKKVRVTEKQVSDVEQWKMYDTSITLPQGGTWTFRVTSGPDQGCFVASF